MFIIMKNKKIIKNLLKKCYTYFGDIMYLVEKTINKLNSNGYTFFLDPKELIEVTSHLKKNSYHAYKPYPYAEKTILYTYQKPDITLYEIKIGIPIRHQDILGTLYSLGIDSSLFGDIIITNNHHYFYTLSNMKTFFEMEFTKIKNSSIELVEKDLHYLDTYQPNFEDIKIITSSLRIDSVIAKVIHTSRDNIKELIKDKKIMLNYDILNNNAKLLQINDIFSIRKIGKYKFDSIISSTKKDNLVIKILKYIDN